MPDEHCPFDDENPPEMVTEAFASALKKICAEADKKAELLVGAKGGEITWRLPGGASVSHTAGRTLFEAMVAAEENGLGPLIRSDGRLTEAGLAWLEQQRRNVAAAFADISGELARATKTPEAK